MVHLRISLAAGLLYIFTSVIAHGQDAPNSRNMTAEQAAHALVEEANWALPSYSGLAAHSSMMLAHIALMVLAWFFILPIGVIFSIVRSQYALAVQFAFLVLNGVGVLLATIYNVSTPDMYEHNAHHTIGWVATWVTTAQVIMSLLCAYSGTKQDPLSGHQAAFLPVSIANMVQHNMTPYSDHRWSGDSGQGTEYPSRDISPNESHRYNKPEGDTEGESDNGGDVAMPMPQAESPRASWFRIKRVDSFLSRRVPGLLSREVRKVIELIYEIVDRTILILGFVALTTGGITYFGIMRGDAVYNGLAHFVKGGIFFWFGLLTLGRWMGCFADLGWAWNVKPTRSEVGQWKARLPSAEFVESFVIFLYGSTNVFLEHLAAWGGEWVAQDLEHVSISIMFFGGGLCGMLVESKTIRKWLNTSIEMMPLPHDAQQAEAQAQRQAPHNYSTSLNPIPALIVLLLGIMMSSHHQNSMVSTTIHKQWGSLFVGFALARALTYLIMWLSPPTSVYASRPPTELLAAFCLLSGGLIFMGSNKDIIRCMEERDLMPMFIFTVVMGFTAFLMAYEILVLSLKGWAQRRELKAAGMRL